MLLENALRRISANEASIQQRFISSALLVLILAACVYLFLYEPNESNVYPKCPFHVLTGLHCPGCGSLRACHQILHGNITGAFGFNPLLVISIPLLIWFIVMHFSIVVRGYTIPGLYIPSRWIWGIFAAIMIFWILRNIPVDPLTALAP